MSTPQARAEEDVIILQRILARRPDSEQNQVLTTTVRAALMRQYAVQVENTALRTELHRTELRFAEAHERNESAMAAYRLAVDERAREAREACAEGLRQLASELATTKAALETAQQERDLLFATLMHNVANAQPTPLPSEVATDDDTLPPTLRQPLLVATEPHATGPRRRSLFRDDEQASAAIRVVLASAGIAYLWDEGGPTQEAKRLRIERTATLSPAEHVLLLTGFDLWAREGRVTLVDLLERVEGESLQALLSLSAAVSAGLLAVDQWLSESSAEFVSVRC
jgi:hypothetical protein